MDKRSKLSPLNGILLAGCVLSGGFHEYVSCLLSIALGIYLIVKIQRQKHIAIKKNLISAAILAICAGYGLSCFWAIDSGMAWIGFCKFAPLALYTLSLWQSEEQGQLRRILPLFGAVTVVISVIGMYIPGLEGYFSVAGRSAGFFQYPNTYALFLLVCELLFVAQPPAQKRYYFVPLVLIAGLLYTGSRIVFVLFFASNLVMIVMQYRKSLWFLLALLAGGALFAAAVMLWGKDTVLYRYLNISLTESTFVGRVLYTVDALPLLLKYPFGMGYMGYYYTQGSIQTGLYSVMYVHNDLLQLFLDIGLVPGGLFAAAIISFFCRKNAEPKIKLIVGTVLVHCLLDFDLQFVFVFLLLIYLMDDPDAKTHNIGCTPVKIGAAAAAVISLYMAIPLLLAHLGLRQAADAMYPFNTQNQIKILEQEQDVDAADKLSRNILSRNTASYIPYSVQSLCAYSKGDFLAVMENKRLALEKAPFCYDEYEQYCGMLINGIQAYWQNGDVESVKICQQELCDVAKRLSAAEHKMSRLGKTINDQPRFDLPEDIQSYINQISSGSENE